MQIFNKMQYLKYVCSLVLFFFGEECKSARILAIAPMPAYSHQIFYRAIWISLLSRGHQITLLTTDPMRDPSLSNLIEINLNFAYELWNQTKLESPNDSFLVKLSTRLEMFINLIDRELEYDEVQLLIKNETQHFDLLMTEFLYPTMYAFSERFKCPIIGLTSLDATTNAYEAAGNPLNPILYPDYTLPFGENLLFFERFVSVTLYIFRKYYMHLRVYPRLDLLVEKHFGPGYSSIYKIEKGVSMLFVNINPGLHNVRPLSPRTIFIGGGTHLKNHESIPKKLEQFLNLATEGVIYFSLGTSVTVKDLPVKIVDEILITLNELPYKVLWRFDGFNITRNLDKINVHKWVQQQEILGHPNVKLFITQGGLQSIEESIFNGVPMIFIPIRQDQPGNAKKFAAKGLGLTMEYKTLNKEILKLAILEVINNPMYVLFTHLITILTPLWSYRQNVKKVAELVMDQPMSGLDKAIWWTEYVLRHKGAHHLKNPADQLSLFQYLLLDVLLIYILFIISIIFVLLATIRCLVKIYHFLLPKKLKQL